MKNFFQKKYFLSSINHKQKLTIVNSNKIDFQIPKIPLIEIKEHLTKEKYSSILNKEGLFLKQKTDDKFAYSSRKLNETIKKIRGKYLPDVIKILNEDYSKGSKYVQMKLKEFLEENKDLIEKEEIVLKVRQAFVGKKKGQNIPVFRAKGRVSFWKRKLCSFTIQFDKILKTQFCERLAVGDISSGFRFLFRQKLYKSRADYDTLKSLSFLTGVKSQIRRKNMILGLIKEIKYKYKSKTGIELADWTIKKELMKDLGTKFIPIYDKYLKKEDKKELKIDKTKEEETRKENALRKRHNNYTKNLKFDY